MVYYDHYNAIYHPLLYTMSMSPRAYIIASRADRVLHGTTQIVYIQKSYFSYFLDVFCSFYPVGFCLVLRQNLAI